VLYCTYNDCDPACLARAGDQDYPVDVFVLDDSSDPSRRDIVDRIADKNGFKVLRRKKRTGFKAGALNNWLRSYGRTYDYIAIMDADSKLPGDFIQGSLAFAEHPSNSDVTIFQAKVNIHNRNNMFTHLLAYSSALWYPAYTRLANRLDWMLCWGHNNILRLSHVIEIGGWDEHHISEDFALAMDLRKKGLRAVLTPIDTFEACPPDFQAYKTRACRWAKGTLKCFEYLPDRRIPYSTRFMLFLTGWCTLAFFGYFVALFLMVYGFRSDFGLILNLTDTMSKNFGWFMARPGALALVTFYFVFLIFGRVILISKRTMTFRTYLSHISLGLAINMMLVLPMIYHQLLAFFKKKVSFKVTPKESSGGGFLSFLGKNVGHMVLTCILMAGVLFYNPISMVYDVFWLTILVFAPLIVWHWQTMAHETEEPPFNEVPVSTPVVTRTVVPRPIVTQAVARD